MGEEVQEESSHVVTFLREEIAGRVRRAHMEGILPKERMDDRAGDDKCPDAGNLVSRSMCDRVGQKRDGNFE